MKLAPKASDFFFIGIPVLTLNSLFLHDRIPDLWSLLTALAMFYVGVFIKQLYIDHLRKPSGDTEGQEDAQQQ